MSVRSSRRLKNLTADLEEKSEPASSKKQRNVKKIRKTLDLIYFDTTLDDMNPGGGKKKTNKNDSDWDMHQENLENRPPDSKRVSNSLKKTPKIANITKTIASNHSDEPNVVLNTVSPNKTNQKRKIVKAKRLLKNKTDDQKCLENVNNSHAEGTCITIKVEEADLVLETSALVVTTLPSPISPSADNSPNSTSLSSKILHFNSSQEDLHPSTTGSVEVSRRRTYELEDSVIDVSLLKSISEQDSQLDIECKTPLDAKYAKVTMRRKWEKIQDSPYNMSGSPKWINKKLKKSLSPLVQPVKDLLMSSTPGKVVTPRMKNSSTKKFVSKVKVPNFAAIHQRALRKIESIDEYAARKEKRAEMLLSGKKPEVVASLSKMESKKQLRFAPNVSNKEKSPTFIPLPSTPLPKRVLNDSVGSPKTPVPFKWEMTKVPRFDCFKPVPEPAKRPQKTPKNDIYKQFNFQKITKPFVFQKTEIKTFNYQQVNKATVFQKPEIKNFIKKSKSEKNTLDSRRCAIKGVRSNRRFELLMNMRKGK